MKSWRKQTPTPQPPRPQKQIKYPSGTAVENEDGDVYLIKNNTRLKIFSPRVLSSWQFSIVRGSKKSLSGYIFGGVVGFRDGSLINNIADGKMYIISENKRRQITTPDFFEKWNFDRSKLIEVSQEEADLHKDGDPI